MSITVKDFGDYSVKNVKSFQGMEGYGFNANLYRGKKKIASVIDSGDGGQVMVYWDDRKTEEPLLAKHLKKLPKITYEYGDFTVDESYFLSNCVTKWETEKDIRRMKKQCQKKTLFRHSLHQDGEYGTVQAVFTNDVKKWLENKYEKVEIFNEVFDKNEIPSVFA
jgi:thymidylate synthase